MSGRVGHSPVGVAARRLCRSLEDHGVLAAAVHEGDDVALVMVSTGLAVWCYRGPDMRLRYKWWTGRYSRVRPGRWVYSECPAQEPVTAARRVVERLRQLPPAQVVVVPVGAGSPISGPG